MNLNGIQNLRAFTDWLDKKREKEPRKMILTDRSKKSEDDVKNGILIMKG